MRENQKADEVEGGESTQEEVFSAEWNVETAVRKASS